MRTAGFWPPLMLTRPTPLSCEILGARRVSTRSSTCDSGMELEVTAKVSTGASAGIVFVVIGGGGGVGGGKHSAGWRLACASVSPLRHVSLLGRLSPPHRAAPQP